MVDTIQTFHDAILERLGYAPDAIEPGKLHRFATRDRRTDLAGWCKLFDDERAGVFGDYRQGISETWFSVDHQCLTIAERAELDRRIATARAEREAQQRDRWAINALRIASMWAESRPLVPGDPATLYLKRRGMAGLWPLPQCLRLHRGLTYWHNGEKAGTFAAMVAPLLAPDGRKVALHRTYLTNDGRKADVPQVKKLTGTAGQLTGACIPLHKPVGGCIGIAEGIETALAAWAGSGVPTVAAYSAGALAAWQWPRDVRRIVVFADADDAGRAASCELRARVRAMSVEIRCDVLTPTDEGLDWCDVWAARQPILVEEVQA
jgi:putative DNA primase/helicase